MVEDSAAVAQRGQIFADIVAFGCTSRGQAHRAGKWLLATEARVNRMINFSAGLDQIATRPGQVFSQTDPLYAGVRMGGRVLASSTSTVVYTDGGLEQIQATATVPSLSETYYLTIQMPDGSVAQSQPVTSVAVSGNGLEITLASALTLADGATASAPDPNATYLLAASGSTSVAPALWRCVSVSEPQKNIFSVFGVKYDPTIFEYVESGLSLSTSTLTAFQGVITAADRTAVEHGHRQLHGRRGCHNERHRHGQLAAVDRRPRDPVSGLRRPEWRHYLPGHDVQRQHRHPEPRDRLLRVLGPRAGCHGQRLDLGQHGHRDRQRQHHCAGAGDGADGGGGCPQRLADLDGQQRAVHRPLRGLAVERHDTAPPTGGALIASVPGTSYLDGDHDTLGVSTEWYYWVRAITSTGTAGPFSSVADATTTDMIADSVADGILTTAAFAQTIRPVELGASLPTTGNFEGRLFYTTPTGPLYEYHSGAWVTEIGGVAVGFPQLVVGNVSAGAIGAIQIAANSIETEMLATTFALANSAQIGTATIETANIAALQVNGQKISGGAVSGAVTDFETSSFAIGTSWSTSAAATIYSDGTANILVMS